MNIVDKINQLARYWLRRNSQIQDFRDYYMLAGRWEVPKAGKIKMMTNLPYNTVRLATAMLGRELPYLAVPERDDTKEEKNRSSEIEHFAYAGLQETDRLSVLMGHDLFRHELPQSLLVDGWYAVEALLDATKDYPFQTRLLDPMFTYPNYTNGGIDFVVHFFITTTKDAYEQWGVRVSNDDDEQITIARCWYYEGTGKSRHVHNTVLASASKGTLSVSKPPAGFQQRTSVEMALLGTTVVIRDEPEPGLKELPVLCGPVSGSHWRTHLYLQDVVDPRSDEIGHPFLYSIAHLINPLNEVLSSFAELIEMYIHPTIVLKSRDGKLTEVQVGKNAVNPLRADDSLEIVYVQGTPPPIGEYLAGVQRLMHEGSIPAAVMGDATNLASGFLLGILDSQTMNHLLRPLRVQEWAYQSIIRSWLQQYQMLSKAEAKKFQNLWGTDAAANHFFVKLDPKVIKDFFGVAVDCMLSTPQAQLARANYHNILVGAGIESREAAREGLRIPIPEREAQRILVEEIRKLPEVTLALAFHQLVKDGLKVEAEILARKLNVPVQTEEGGPLVNPKTGLPERPLPAPEAAPSQVTQGQAVPEVAAGEGVGPAGHSTGEEEEMLRQLGLL